MLFHAQHAASHGADAVVISSEDTDVYILCLAFSFQIAAPLFLQTSMRNRSTITNITLTAASLGSDVCRALVGMHAYTGCDSVSALAGKGKIQALKLVMENNLAQKAFKKLGESWLLSEAQLKSLEHITCAIYSSKNTESVDQVRYDMFCAKNDVKSHQLPPCSNCLILHANRANYQAAVWRRSLMADPQCSSLVECGGWKFELKEDRECLVINWMNIPPAPDAVLELLSCKCTKSCNAPSCVCVVNGLKCTDMCRLKKCTNQPDDNDTTEIIADNETDDDDDDANDNDD
jgi:hypothetical protein